MFFLIKYLVRIWRRHQASASTNTTTTEHNHES